MNQVQGAGEVYLAGPGVFRRDAPAFAGALKAGCRAQGLVPLWPLDNELVAESDRARLADHIRRANEAMIRRANAVVAEIAPFRGPNMDPGTAYEIGFAIALNKPVFAWSTEVRTLLARTPATTHADGMAYDEADFAVEDFGLIENLMIATAVQGLYTTAEAAIAACAAHLREVADPKNRD
jgi:nucleoside 2-deoxyribosyltransferase